MTKISGHKKTEKNRMLEIMPNSTYCWASVSTEKRPYEYRNLGNDRRVFPELVEHKRLNNQGNGGHERQNFADMMQLKRRKNHGNGGNARRKLPDARA